MQASNLSQRLDDTLRRYHIRAVDSEVVEELIALAREIIAASARSAELRLNSEELALSDALAANGSAKTLMEHEQLRVPAQLPVKTIRNLTSINWTQKESVRAEMRIEVRKLLAPTATRLTCSGRQSIFCYGKRSCWPLLSPGRKALT